jgi:hypothetical protein
MSRTDGFRPDRLAWNHVERGSARFFVRRKRRKAGEPLAIRSIYGVCRMGVSVVEVVVGLRIALMWERVAGITELVTYQLRGTRSGSRLWLIVFRPRFMGTRKRRLRFVLVKRAHGAGLAGCETLLL